MASGSGCASPPGSSSEIVVEVVSQDRETLSKGCKIMFSTMPEEIPGLEACCPHPGQSKPICCDILLGLGQGRGFGAGCCRSWWYCLAAVRLEAPCKANRKRKEVGSFDCSGCQFWVISAQAEPDPEGKRCCRANGKGWC